MLPRAIRRMAVDFRLLFAYHPGMLPLTKRQREILDYLNEFIQQHGYAPSLEEIGRRFNLSSLATVHKHLTNCLLYTSDAADERSSVDLGGRRIIKKKK